LCLVGTGVAGVSAVLALTRLGTWQALVFAVVAVVSAMLGAAVLRAERWALWIITVGSAGQIGAVVGTVWELQTGVEATKAAELRRLGFAPTFGVVINLGYSALASLMFAWITARWMRARRLERREQ
jgi:hypothetical protein